VQYCWYELHLVVVYLDCCVWGCQFGGGFGEVSVDCVVFVVLLSVESWCDDDVVVEWL